MLSFLKGLLVSKAYESPRGAYFLVDMHGMGFEVLTSQRSIESSPPPGEHVQLFTALIVREDAMFLVGFNTKEERDLKRKGDTATAQEEFRQRVERLGHKYVRGTSLDDVLQALEGQ